MGRGLPPTPTHFLIGFPELKMGGFVTVSRGEHTPFSFAKEGKVTE